MYLLVVSGWFSQDGISPLCVASAEGHTETVGILLKAGADPNQACIKVLYSPIDTKLDQKIFTNAIDT